MGRVRVVGNRERRASEEVQGKRKRREGEQAERESEEELGSEEGGIVRRGREGRHAVER